MISKKNISAQKKIDAVIDQRLKPLRNISCPKLVTNIIDKKVVVDEKEEVELNIEPKMQKFINKLDKKMKSNRNYDYIVKKRGDIWRDKQKLMGVLALSDKLNPSREQKYSYPNRFRSLCATSRPVKTAEAPPEVPIADMIMQNIDKLSVAPGVWNKLCSQHSVINHEITQTHVNETKGPDLTIENLRKQNQFLRSQNISPDGSPTNKGRATSRQFSSRRSLLSRDSTQRRLKKGKCQFENKQEENRPKQRLFKNNSELASINFQMDSLRSKKDDPEVIKVMERINENIKHILAPPSKRKFVKKRKRSISDYSFSSGNSP